MILFLNVWDDLLVIYYIIIDYYRCVDKRVL